MRSEITDEIGDVRFLDQKYDAAIIGIAENHAEAVVAYSKKRVIEILIENGMADEDDANEFFEYNILGTGMQGRMPIFISLMKDNHND